MNNLGIYVHIPFCVRKCNYCDFLSGESTRDEREEYVHLLCKEIELRSVNLRERIVDTLFIGGGTPSLLEPELMEIILMKLKKTFQFSEQGEYSIECNPGTVTPDKFSIYHEYGINRLSFGLQATNEEVLKKLGRIHTFDEFVDSFNMARNHGFNNINVDMMEALPGQSQDEFMEGLKQVVAMEPEHLSVYSLIIEEGTKFYEQYKDNPPYSDEAERNLYWRTHEYLTDSGYEHYEISNYAKPGYACRHNLKYWNRDEYIGFGLGAASFIGNERLTNSSQREDYPQFAPIIERISQVMAREEQVFLGLRKSDGVEYSKELQQHYGPIVENMVEHQLLKREDNRLILTHRGVDISNFVMSEFIQ